jgi:hypothetical protein
MIEILPPPNAIFAVTSTERIRCYRGPSGQLDPMPSHECPQSFAAGFQGRVSLPIARGERQLVVRSDSSPGNFGSDGPQEAADGTYAVYVGGGQLLVGAMDQLDAVPLSGITDARSPFLSPGVAMLSLRRHRSHRLRKVRDVLAVPTPLTVDHAAIRQSAGDRRLGGRDG